MAVTAERLADIVLLSMPSWVGCIVYNSLELKQTQTQAPNLPCDQGSPQALGNNREGR